MGEPEPEPEDDLYELPAWSLSRDSDEWVQIANPLPERVDREWALAGATGKGVRVCLLDSGVEDGHPRVGPVTRAVAITVGEDEEPIATEDLEGDLCGHGTACASVVPWSWKSPTPRARESAAANANSLATLSPRAKAIAPRTSATCASR